MPCDFSHDHYREILILAGEDHKVLSLGEYVLGRPERVLLLRHDVDYNPQRAAQMAVIEHDHGVRATYFVRVHADLYNPFGFKTYMALKQILKTEHEIGLHVENTDFSHVSSEDASSVLRRGIQALQAILDTKIAGVAAHGDWSGIDNADFIRKIDPADYGLDYEASRLTADCKFISDSMRIWKGTDGRCVCQPPALDSARICLLTHPDLWYRAAYHLD